MKNTSRKRLNARSDFSSYLYCKFKKMSDPAICPKCHSDLTYPDRERTICTQCFYEWDAAEKEADTADAVKIVDANGNELQDGDTVILIKDLPVKGAPKPLKAGTKVKNIKLTDGDHNIDCKIDGYGAMALKSQYVKKA